MLWGRDKKRMHRISREDISNNITRKNEYNPTISFTFTDGSFIDFPSPRRMVLGHKLSKRTKEKVTLEAFRELASA